MIATENELQTSTSTSLDEKGVCQSSTPWHTPQKHSGRVAELVDALVLGTSGVTRESSSLSLPTTTGRHS